MGGSKVAWEDLTLPLDEGGLGMKKLVEWNMASMGTHLWKLCQPLPSSNWAAWARANLLRGRSLWDVQIPSNNSWTWRKVLQLRPLYRPLFKYIMGDGLNISLWFDNWLPSGPIHSHMGDRVIYDAGLARNANVAVIIHEHHWQWPVANSSDLLALKEETQALSFHPSGLQDSIFWLPSSSGLFSTSSAWEQLREYKNPVPWRHIVWFPGSIPKASFILWLAVKKKLGTQDRLHNLPPGARCLLCNSQQETHDHLFFDCSFSSHIWSSLCLFFDCSFSSHIWFSLC